MRKAEVRTIDGLEFTVQQLPGMRALKLQYRLAASGLPAVLKAVAGKSAGLAGGLANVDLSEFSDAAALFFEKFSEADFEALVRELNETTRVKVEGKETLLMPVFDDVMAGRPETVLKLLGFGLEVNFKSFFGVLLEGARRLKADASPSGV